MKQNNNFARALHFFVLFFAVTTTLLRSENTYFHVLSMENVNKRGGNILSLKFPYTFSIVAKNPISEAQEVVFIFFLSHTIFSLRFDMDELFFLACTRLPLPGSKAERRKEAGRVNLFGVLMLQRKKNI